MSVFCVLLTYHWENINVGLFFFQWWRNMLPQMDTDEWTRHLEIIYDYVLKSSWFQFQFKLVRVACVWADKKSSLSGGILTELQKELIIVMFPGIFDFGFSFSKISLLYCGIMHLYTEVIVHNTAAASNTSIILAYIWWGFVLSQRDGEGWTRIWEMMYNHFHWE